MLSLGNVFVMCSSPHNGAMKAPSTILCFEVNEALGRSLRVASSVLNTWKSSVASGLPPIDFCAYPGGWFYTGQRHASWHVEHWAPHDGQAGCLHCRLFPGGTALLHGGLHERGVGTRSSRNHEVRCVWRSQRGDVSHAGLCTVSQQRACEWLNWAVSMVVLR